MTTGNPVLVSVMCRDRSERRTYKKLKLEKIKTTNGSTFKSLIRRLFPDRLNSILNKLRSLVPGVSGSVNKLRKENLQVGSIAKQIVELI